MNLLLVDALNLIRRVYAAQPGEDGPERAEGARTSCVQSLRRGLKECTPTHAACVFEGEGLSWRHELCDAYKAGHKPMPGALHAALDSYREAFSEIGVRSVSIPELEADDVVATMAYKATVAGIRVTVLSTDKTFAQLLPFGVRLRDHFKGADLDTKYVVEKFGVRPEQLVDLLALAGDPGNGIPGVSGIGPKTAAGLLVRFETFERVLQSAGDLKGKLGEHLREEAETARLCRTLVALRTDLELDINLNALRLQPSS